MGLVGFIRGLTLAYASASAHYAHDPAVRQSNELGMHKALMVIYLRYLM